MKIKTKLLIGFGLLFVVVVVFGIVSVYYIDDISHYSNATLKNNYATLTYTREMRAVLDENDLPLPAAAVASFDSSLKKQEHNITEPGEKEATAGVRSAFTQLTSATVPLAEKQRAVRAIRLQLQTIDGLNMKAVVQKNNSVTATVSNATLYLGAIVFVTFLILFVFIVNFPGFILKPLNRFIDGVREINQKNYDARLEFESNDEFAELAVQFNKMAAALAHNDDKKLTKIIAGENQVKILIEQIPDIVIGLNEQHQILFVNSAARKALGIGDKLVNGQAVDTVVESSALLHAILQSKAGDPAKKVLHYQMQGFEIVVPNLRPSPADGLQFAGYPAGMIYILKDIKKAEPVE